MVGAARPTIWYWCILALQHKTWPRSQSHIPPGLQGGINGEVSLHHDLAEMDGTDNISSLPWPFEIVLWWMLPSLHFHVSSVTRNGQQPPKEADSGTVKVTRNSRNMRRFTHCRPMKYTRLDPPSALEMISSESYRSYVDRAGCPWSPKQRTSQDEAAAG